MIDWLESKKSYINNDEKIIYPLNSAKYKFEVINLCENGYLVLDRNDDSWIRFAVLERYISDTNGENIELSCIFHGEGPGDGLRECRHTYWGEDGYIFYPKGEIISAAFKALSEFYDEMV